MLFPTFGQEISQELRPVKQLSDALRSSEKVALSSYETQILLRELYDQNFQISAHSDPRRPLSLVAMQPKETQGPYSRKYRIYHRFASLNVGELFKISITDFLKLPREEVEMMFTIAEHRTQTKGKEDQDTTDTIARELRRREQQGQ